LMLVYNKQRLAATRARIAALLADPTRRAA
jgi:hypothetical protein